MKLVNIHKRKFALAAFMLFAAAPGAMAQPWTMQQCLDTALVHNRNLQIERNNIEIGEQKRKEAKSSLLPKINAVVDYRYFFELPYQLMPMTVFGGEEGQFREAQFGVPHNINANLQLNMPLYNPQIYGAVQATAIAGDLAELQYRKTEEQVFFDISNLYHNAQLLYHQLEFVRSNLANTERLLDNMRLLNEQLLARATDVKKVQLQLDELRDREELIQSHYDQVLNALKFQMGIPLESSIDIDKNILYADPQLYEEFPAVDIRIARAHNRLLQQELKTLKYSKLPTLSLYGTFGTTGYGYDQQPNDFLNFYPSGFVGVQLNYPLFTGLTTRKKLKQKKIELQNSDLRIRQIDEQSGMQVENASRQRRISERTISTTRAQIRLAEEVYEQTILQQKQGTATLTDVLMADNDLREAQQNHLNAIVEYLKADLELKRLSGNFLPNTK